MATIVGVRTVPYNYTMTRRIGDVHLPDGTDSGSDMAVFVDTDEGISGVAIGYGQGSSDVQRFAKLVIGEDPRATRALWERMVALSFKMGLAGGTKIAVSAIDAALWDLKAKLNGVPLWKEVGAVEGSAAGYASGLDTPLSDSELDSFYRRMAARGFNAGKLKVGADQDADLRRLGIMKEALASSGKHPVLMVDSNEYWTPKQSIARIREMEREFDLLWAEEPAGRRDVVGLRTVSRAITAAVATGENLDSSADFAALIRAEAVDVIQIGALTSGITGALQVADMAYANGIPVAMMNCPGRHMAHVAAALPHHLMMEILDCGRDQAFSHEAELVDGRVQLGNAPGSGIVIRAEVLEGTDVVEPSPSSLRAIYRKSPGSWINESRSPGRE